MKKIKSSELIIFGTGKIAQILYNCIKSEAAPRWNITAFCIDSKYRDKEELYGLPIISFEEVSQHFPPEKYDMIIAIGYHELNNIRSLKCSEAINMGYNLATYVHSDVDIRNNAKIGKNCLILDHVSIGSFAEIGNNVFIYSNATIAHHAKIEDNVWITSGTVIGGNSCVGKNTFLGINSTIGHNISIGENNFIGAGGILTKCTGNDEVYITPDTPKHRLNSAQFLKIFKFD